jgi:hypothetical protein
MAWSNSAPASKSDSAGAHFVASPISIELAMARRNGSIFAALSMLNS